MKKFLTLLALICVSAMAFSVDWNAVEWLGNGVGEGYSEKYKAVVEPELPVPGFINNLQRRNDVPVLHVCFPSAAFGAFSLDASQYDIEGAGAFFHLDAFTQKETVFTAECESVTYTFTVFYVDGTGGTEGIENTVSEKKARKVVENGMLYIEQNGVRFNILGGQVRK